MQDTKLKIDFNQGLLEVEGSEALVREIYNDFKDALKSMPQSTPVTTTVLDGASTTQSERPSSEVKSSPKPKSKAKPKAKAKAKAKSKSSTDTTGTLLKDLNLMNEGSSESLRDFYGKYEVKTNLERTLIFVYYLDQVRGIVGININHIFTCYRNIDGLKIPGHLKQNLLDTSSKKGWLDTADMDDIKVPVTGVNYIEHDLPKTVSSD
jgi:hypothetical protein